MQNIDTNKYKILLIGVSQYPNDRKLHNLPNVKSNIKNLYKIFSDPNYLGVPKKNIIVSLDEGKIEIERKLVKFFKHFVQNDDTAIIYYSGHGLISPENFKVYLSTKDTSFSLLEAESIDITQLSHLFNNIITDKKVLMIDACYSGQIHKKINFNEFSGGYIITSTSDNSPSLYPDKKPKYPTYFTGELIDILKKGLHNKKKYITVAEAYRELSKRLKRKKLPIPVKSTSTKGRHIILAKNRYGKKSQHQVPLLKKLSFFK